MSQDILIPSSHFKYLLSAYRQRINTIDATVKELVAEKNELESVISKYSSKEGIASGNHEIKNTTTYTTEYQSYWPWFTKAVFILKASSGKALTTAEIVEQMITYEPLLNRKKALGSMSATISSKIKEGKIKRIINNGAVQTYQLTT